jgi:hypothetical protein
MSDRAFFCEGGGASSATSVKRCSAYQMHIKAIVKDMKFMSCKSMIGVSHISRP